MEFSFKEIKKGLIKYFTKVEKYKLYKSSIDENIIYFYSKKNEINVIRIANAPIDEKYDKEFKKIVKKLKLSQRQLPNILNIIIDNEKNEIITDENIKTIICGESNLRNNLHDLFPKIHLLSIKKKDDDSYIKKTSKIDLDSNNDSEESTDTVEAIQDEYNKFQTSIKTNRLLTSWLLIAAFIVVPLILIFVTINMGIAAYANVLGLEQLQTLFTGGTNFNLTIAGGQYWRILSWGIATPASNFFTNIFLLLICGMSLFSLLRVTENIAGSIKMLISFILAYIITGLFSSVMLKPGYVLGGIVPILAIIVGITGLSIATEKTMKATFTRIKLIWPVTILIIFPLLLGDSTLYIPIIVGLSAGGMIQMILKQGFKPWNWTFFVPVLVLLALIIVPVVFWILPRYVTAIDYTTLWVLKLYIINNLLSDVDKANDIIDNINWNAYLRQDGDFITIVVGYK